MPTSHLQQDVEHGADAAGTECKGGGGEFEEAETVIEKDIWNSGTRLFLITVDEFPSREASWKGCWTEGRTLQRLRVDPMAIYGTNCLKFADGDEEESRPFLLRELHIVQPKLVVVMGEPARAFLNSVKFPLSSEIRETTGELQRFTPTIQALVTPDIDEALDEAPAKTAFWNAFKTLGTWWAELPPY